MNKNNINHIIIIFSSAIALRLLYFFLALNELGIDNYFSSISDTEVYWAIAQHLMDYNINGEYWIFQVGAGYGAVIALVYSLFNQSLYALYLFHIIAGSLIPLVIYQIASRLFKNRTIAFLSGIFCAVSFTGVTLSCNILSDILFVLIFSTSLWFYIIGIQSDKIKWYLLAGLLAGLSIYIRAITIFYPIIFLSIPLALVILKDKKLIAVQILKKSFLVVAIMSVMILSWSARNYYVNEVFTFGANGAKSAKLRLAAKAVSNRADNLNYTEIKDKWLSEDSVLFDSQVPAFAQEYNRDVEHFLSQFKKHPDWIMLQFVENIYRNIVTGNYIPTQQIKSMDSTWRSIGEINKYFFGPLLYLLTFMALIFLYRRRNFVPLSVLGLNYVYFTFITGFSMNQGTRLHFPAEISFSILTAFVVCEILRIIKEKRII